ncbi:MAG: hypothetical protein GPJ54_10875 [Candidatus Heimdallarchaeota archaeon]|nr:hypothetical protein [Candidatus Heimdallarchaeota archaeon]
MSLKKPMVEISFDVAGLTPFLLSLLAIIVITSILYKSRMSTTYASGLFFIAFLALIADHLVENYADEYSLDEQSTYIAGMVVTVVIFTHLFNSRTIKPLKHVIQQTNKMADGDFEEDDKRLSGSGEAKSLLSANRVLSNRFKSIVGNIKNSSENLASSAEELAASSEEVAATTEEVTGTIQTIAEGAAEQVKRLEDVSRVLNSMTNVIEESIRQIGTTAKITLDLADQTNLVSLNAAIEAAKAGIQGQGFQVVADHVRQLSIESKNASTSVTEITNRISERMRDSVYEIITAVEKIATVAENTAASSEEAAAAAEEQAASLQEITRQAQRLAELSETSEKSVSELMVN